ncbi:MAG: Gfo/Idh/MocA family oxidoreductase [Candidatus Heimdallarchaeota archaeon]|nr:MAG: Gfo/Idh/MocA family oxidoreductase [Candidatus Heimdallarchaeota archaeon]
MYTNSLKFGLIGCGSFGVYCLNTFSGLKEIEIVAVADTDEGSAKRIGQQFGVEWYNNPIELIQRHDIDLIHIATPPHTHYELGVQAIKNGKHVLCEKPLALSLEEAEEMLKLAEQMNIIIPVDFVLRYVPIVDIIKNTIQSRVLGNPIHAYFENYASDEGLSQNHWFWDEHKSGGIFIEHAVHFFDLYSYWFGETKVLWANSQIRHNTNQRDRVFCVLQHDDVLSNHYHGFDQPNILDRQTHKILFETGDVTVNGWIPISFSLNGIVDDEQIDILTSMCPNGKLTVIEDIETSNQKMRGRGKLIKVTKRIHFQYSSPLGKTEVYAQAVRNLLLDQIRFIQNPNHERIITESNGVNALKLALKAVQLSK